MSDPQPAFDPDKIRAAVEARPVSPMDDDPPAAGEGAEEVAEDQVDDEPVDDESEEDEEVGAGTADPPAGPSDELIERAVRAGISMQEAKQFPNDDLLAAMCSRVEAVGGAASSSESAGGGGGEPLTTLESIPDLDEEVVEESIVAAFKSLKEFALRQEKKIAELEGGRSNDWLTTKLEGVKDVTGGDAEKSAKLKAKFSVLKAGYKAAGDAPDDDAIFDEAAKLVLGDDMVAHRKKVKNEAARKRNGQLLKRPSGNRVKPRMGAREEIEGILAEKFDFSS